MFPTRNNNLNREMVLDRYKLSKVIEMVAKGEKSIANCKGKDLIIFIGGTQVGKSTTINSLLGVPIQETDEGDMEVISPSEPIAPMGILNEGGVSCTEFPALYISPDSSFCFLDTQGFFEMRKNQEMVIASSILMEMAINQANSIRIVNLNKYETFNSGIYEFNRFGEVLSRIVIKEDVPMYFLFNRFTLTQNLYSNGFFSWDESRQHQYIKDKIKDAFQRIIKAGEKISDGVIKRIFQKAIDCGRLIVKANYDPTASVEEIWNGMSDNCSSMISDANILATADEDPEVVERQKITRYLSLLKKSLENEYFGYIDPTSQFSIGKFLQDIIKVPEINKSDLVFSGYNSDRVLFNQIFEKRLQYCIPIMKNYLFSQLYTNETISILIQNLNSQIEKCKNDLMIIQESGITDELLSEYTENSIEELKKYEKIILSLQEEKESVDLFISTFQRKPPIPYWIDIWNEKAKLYWWRNHLCKYPLNIPYVDVLEELDKNTERREVIKDQSPEYEVMYSSGGKVRRSCAKVATVLISPAGFVALSASSHGTSGKVTISCFPKDIEPNILPQMRRDSANLKKEIDKTNETLSQIKNENKSSLVEIINTLISRQEKQLESLNKIQEFVHDIVITWKKDDPKCRGLQSISEEVSSYDSIIKKLYSGPIEKESVNNFINLYQKIISAKPIDITLIEKESLISEFNLLQ